MPRRRPYMPRPPVAAEAFHARWIVALVDRLAAQVRRRIVPVLERAQRKAGRLDGSQLPLPLPIDFDREIRDVKVAWRRWANPAEIARWTKRSAGKIDEHNREQVARQLQSIGVDVFKEAKRGQILAGLLPAWTADHVQLIVTGRPTRLDPMLALGPKAIGQIDALVRDGFQAGRRHESIMRDIEDRLGVARNRARLIARDQTNKLNGALTRERQVKAGIREYTWRTSKDSRVRDEHASLEGEIFAWDKPPSVGHPGEPVQCRCVASPVVPRAGKGEASTTPASAGNTQARPAKASKAWPKRTQTGFSIPQPPAALPAPKPKARKPARRTVDPLTNPAIEFYGVDPKALGAEQAGHLKDLGRLPRRFFDAYAREGGKVAIVNGAVPTFPPLAGLANDQPRGWPPGRTWNDVSGVYDRWTKTAVAGSVAGGHGSASMVLHELGHAVDHVFGVAGLDLTRTPEFADVFVAARDSGQLLATLALDNVERLSYYTQTGWAGAEETFAESFAMYHRYPATLAHGAPGLFRFMDDLHAKHGSPRKRVPKAPKPTKAKVTSRKDAAGRVDLVWVRAEDPHGRLKGDAFFPPEP